MISDKAILILIYVGIFILGEIFYICALKQNKKDPWFEVKMWSFMASLMVAGALCFMLIILIIIKGIIWLFKNITLAYIINILHSISTAVYVIGGIAIFFYINYLISKLVRRKKK